MNETEWSTKKQIDTAKEVTYRLVKFEIELRRKFEGLKKRKPNLAQPSDFTVRNLFDIFYNELGVMAPLSVLCLMYIDEVSRRTGENTGPSRGISGDKMRKATDTVMEKLHDGTFDEEVNGYLENIQRKIDSL